MNTAYAQSKLLRKRQRPNKPRCPGRSKFPIWLQAAFSLAIAINALKLASADTYPRVAGVDVLEYVFRLTVTDDSDTISGLTTVQIRFNRDGITQLPLDLVGTDAAAKTSVGQDH